MVVETTLLPPGFLLEAKDDMMVRWLGKSLIQCVQKEFAYLLSFSPNYLVMISPKKMHILTVIVMKSVHSWKIYYGMGIVAFCNVFS